MRKILAIDDSKTIRLAIKITFAAEQAEVVAVSKGSEAVARAKHMGAQVVLVDHALAASEPSGPEVVKTLKADPATAGIPVVLMVPAKGQYDEAAASGCGADDTITKPFESQALLDKVAALIGGAVHKAPASSAAPAPKPAAPAPRAAPTPKAAAPAPKAAAPAPAPTPVAAAAAPTAAPATAPTASGGIPIAIPIPFAASDAPTSSMLARLKDGGAASGLDPAAVQALLSLSHEVVEQVVWEVVPELAEQIIRNRA